MLDIKFVAFFGLLEEDVNSLNRVHAALPAPEHRFDLGGSAEAFVTVQDVPPELPIYGDYPPFPRLFLY